MYVIRTFRCKRTNRYKGRWVYDYYCLPRDPGPKPGTDPMAPPTTTKPLLRQTMRSVNRNR
jgi:hypothetical protein